ncbi:MAG: tryptophan-rich sensory protein, partial [Blastocatellia bacterium]|nr:tryptophan-rich sensory protein [Blastocatellia bacterium]
MAEENNNYDRLRAVLVLVATAAVIIFNALAASGRLFGVDTGDVSNRYPTVITPAGYAFSIWSLIYLGLVAFSIYQLLPVQLAKFRGVRTMYLLSCVFNCAWLFAWH